jgi:hypothetical protein
MAGVDLEEFVVPHNIMVFGPIGVGKTIFGAGAPNNLIWNCEPGIASAKRMGLHPKAEWIRSWSDAWEMMEEAESGNTGGHDWFTIDTLSTLENLDMRQVLEEMVERNPRRDPDLPDRAEHQLRQNRLKRFVERMTDIPVNKLWLCHEMRVEDDNGETLVLPSISGGADKGYPVANYIMSLMNAVGYMNVADIRENEEVPEEEETTPRKGKAKLRAPTRRVRRIVWEPLTANGVTYRVKEHFGGVLGRWTDDLSMPDIIDLIGPTGIPRAEEPPARPVKRARRAIAK